MILETIKLLGLRARDRVTGFEGVITSANFDLYGCVQVVMVPPAEGGKLEDGRWFDVGRLEMLSDESVLPTPAFIQYAGVPTSYDKGAAPKSLPPGQ